MTPADKHQPVYGGLVPPTTIRRKNGMKILRKTALTAGALTLALLPTTAVAHNGAHPFDNCAEAYENGYSNIPKGDEHYGDHLDRDKDGTGCDNPPKDFTPAPEETEPASPAPAEKPKDDELAETGGDDTTTYIAAAGAAAVLLGAGAVFLTRRRAARN